MKRFNKSLKDLSTAQIKIEETIGGEQRDWMNFLETRREEIFNDLKNNQQKYQELIPDYMDQLNQNDFDFESWVEENGFTW